MNRLNRRDSIRAVTAAALGLAGFSGRLAAADWVPDKPIRLVLPYTPGGASDMLSRMIAERLSTRLGQPVVMEYKPGGGLVIGSEYVARQPPDGTTLYLTTTTFNLHPLLSKTSYDPVKDFTHLALLADVPMVIAANPAKVGFRTPQEFLAWARQNPGNAFYALPTRGGTGELIGELINSRAGVKLQPVIYKGGAPMMVDVLAGQVPLSVETLGTFRPYLESRQMVLIAVAARTRLQAYPQVPTLSETVLPGFDISAWFALQMPRGVPEPIVSRLNREVNEILKEQAMINAFAQVGATVVGGSSQSASETIAARTALFGQIIKTANIKAQ